VKQISADSQEKTDANIPALRPNQEGAYRALISLDRPGQGLRLMPGMLVSAEIHLGTRSVMEYLLSPVQKISHEAGRER
jgi:hemolysin D